MQEKKDLRGRAAIERAHAVSSFVDESRVNSAISELYGVDIREAVDIHANFHIERLTKLLAKRAREHGMTDNAFQKTVSSLDLYDVATKIASGSLAEAAACDIVFNSIRDIENRGKSEDRYHGFYG